MDILTKYIEKKEFLFTDPGYDAKWGTMHDLQNVLNNFMNKWNKHMYFIVLIQYLMIAIYHILVSNHLF